MCFDECACFKCISISIIDSHSLYHHASITHEVPVSYNCGLAFSQSASQQTLIKSLIFVYLFIHSTYVYSMPRICSIMAWAWEIQQWVQLTVSSSSRTYRPVRRENKQGSKYIYLYLGIQG